MARVEAGNTVKVHYTAKLQDGTVIDSSRGGDPVELTLGHSHVIPGFEEALHGMAPGESRTTRIPPEKAYGSRRQELVFDAPRSGFPPEIKPEVGLGLQMTTQGGRNVRVTVAAVSEQSVTLDANHPLCGKELVFDIELVAIPDGPSCSDAGDCCCHHG
jgi:peptidylprolyl isomerase